MRDVCAISKGLAQGAQRNVEKAAPVLVISTAILLIELNRQFNDEYLSEHTTDDVGSDIIAEECLHAVLVTQFGIHGHVPNLPGGLALEAVLSPEGARLWRELFRREVLR